MARNTRCLQALTVGTPVAIQNQSGCYPSKWNKMLEIMEVRPNEQIVIKVDGSRRLLLRNRIFMRELDLRKTGLVDNQRTASQMPVPGRTRHYAVTSPSSRPPPSQPTPPKTADEPTRDTETLNDGDLLPTQKDGDADQHNDGEDHQPHDVPVEDTAPVDNPEARPVRKKKPNMRYPATVFDLSSVSNCLHLMNRGMVMGKPFFS